MGLDIVAQNVNGYYYSIEFGQKGMQRKCLGQVLYFSPFKGYELEGALRWQIQEEFFSRLHKDSQNFGQLSAVINGKKVLSSNFDFQVLPDEFKDLINDRRWFDIYLQKQRHEHLESADYLCSGFSTFISLRYGEYKIPPLACVPIQYCPFCGVKLPPEFDQENWWEKEFKTFKWYKDHKLGEWADDYVDDHDWTEADYPPIDDKEEEK